MTFIYEENDIIFTFEDFKIYKYRHWMMGQIFKYCLNGIISFSSQNMITK